MSYRSIVSKRFALITISALCSCSGLNYPAARAETRAATMPGAVAVVELFTSEGCSSCPPADTVLAAIARDARERNVAVYPIAFHIDYWDRLGWKDPFSSAAATARQQTYAQALGSSQYTPQMIMNGRTEFVGSDSDRAKKEIAAALIEPVAARVRVSASRASDSSLAVEYSVEKAPRSAVLNVVVVEGALKTQVHHGENAGRTLHHENVARAIKTFSLDAGATGKITLDVPAGMSDSNVSVIAYVQEASMRIVGASSAAIAAPVARPPSH